MGRAGGGGPAGGAWAPRWFRAVDAEAARAAGALHANDADPGDCPVFEFSGDLDAAFNKKGDGGGGGAGGGSCTGRGFCPWQFPDLHSELRDYEAPPSLPPAAE